jgi:hypothetical protein
MEKDYNYLEFFMFQVYVQETSIYLAQAGLSINGGPTSSAVAAPIGFGTS